MNKNYQQEKSISKQFIILWKHWPWKHWWKGQWECGRYEGISDFYHVYLRYFLPISYSDKISYDISSIRIFIQIRIAYELSFTGQVIVYHKNSNSHITL